MPIISDQGRKPIPSRYRRSSRGHYASLHPALSDVKSGHMHIHTKMQQVLEDWKGVCQDFAHLMLSVCRQQGIPSRYVSGYVYSPRQATMHADQVSQAWVECLMPDGFWRGFDPTNNLLVDDHYERIHAGRDYTTCAPTKGIYRGDSSAAPEMTVTVDVLPA